MCSRAQCSIQMTQFKLHGDFFYLPVLHIHTHKHKHTMLLSRLFIFYANVGANKVSVLLSNMRRESTESAKDREKKKTCWWLAVCVCVCFLSAFAPTKVEKFPHSFFCLRSKQSDNSVCVCVCVCCRFGYFCTQTKRVCAL